jgi:hypothetical protein
MAALADDDRASVARAWTERVFVQDNVTASVGGPDIAAAVAAIDDWVEANAPEFDAQFPEPFHSAASYDGKVKLLALILMRRAGL